MKDYLRIWTTKERVMTLLSFKKLQDALPSRGFIRIHKSYLISIDKIEKIERNHVTIGSESLPIGDSFRREFFEVIDQNKIN